MITSFFGKSASKKNEGDEKCEGVENSAKSKADTAASGNANEGAKKSQDDIKQNTVVGEAAKRKSSSVEGEAEELTNKKPRSAENPNHKLTGEEKKNQEGCDTSMDTSAEPMTANSIENLAPEILINIFGFLPFDDLKSATLVCRFVKSHEFLYFDLESLH